MCHKHNWSSLKHHSASYCTIGQFTSVIVNQIISAEYRPTDSKVHYLLIFDWKFVFFFQLITIICVRCCVVDWRPYARCICWTQLNLCHQWQWLLLMFRHRSLQIMLIKLEVNFNFIHAANNTISLEVLNLMPKNMLYIFVRKYIICIWMSENEYGISIHNMNIKVK